VQNDAATAAAGRGAPATGATARHLCGRQQDELASLVHRLQQAVETHRGDLDRPDDVEGMVGMVARQLRSGQRPHRPMVHALLAGIAEAAEPAAPVIEAAGALADFLQQRR
jgi:hypothetical protein